MSHVSFGHGISKNSDKGQSMVQKEIRLISKSTKVSQVFRINRDRNLGDFEISQLKGHLKSTSKSNDKSLAQANQCNYKQKSN